MNTLLIFFVLASPSQAPKPKAAPADPNQAVLRCLRPGEPVVLVSDPDVILRFEEATEAGDPEKISQFLAKAQQAGEWRRLPAYTPATFLEDRQVKGRSLLSLNKVRITDGPSKGVEGWVTKTAVVRAEGGMSIERKLDLEKAVANKKARDAAASLARAKKKAAQIKDDAEREAYLAKMAPIWDAQARDNARLTMEAQRLQISAMNAESLRRSAQAMEKEAAINYYRSGAPIIYDPFTGPRPYGLPR